MAESFDVITTQIGLSHGGIEANPLMKHIVTSIPLMCAVKFIPVLALILFYFSKRKVSNIFLFALSFSGLFTLGVGISNTCFILHSMGRI